MNSAKKNIAILFPGQGSQYKGMLTNIPQNPTIKETIEEGSDILSIDFSKLFVEDSDRLNQTQFTQPALLVANVAFWRLWKNQTTLQPTVMAGHSLGEYAALVASNSISFKNALELVRARAQFMSEAVAPNTAKMAVILGLEAETVTRLCDEHMQQHNTIVEVANFNSTNQVVIAGYNLAVEAVCLTCKQAGAKRILPLAVSVPAHCKLMTPASQHFKQTIEDYKTQITIPDTAVIQNYSLNTPTNSEEIINNLIQQIVAPVRWVPTINKMVNDYQVNEFVECGPGKVLTGLTNRIATNSTFLQLDGNWLQEYLKN